MSLHQSADRAERIASQTMQVVIEMTELEDADATMASLFLLREAAAHLQVFAGFQPDEALALMARFTAERVAELRAEQDDSRAVRSKATAKDPVPSLAIH
jgi:hypothetical protein